MDWASRVKYLDETSFREPLGSWIRPFLTRKRSHLPVSCGPAVDLVVFAQSDPVLNAILSIADRQTGSASGLHDDPLIGGTERLGEPG
jgi:hypothetical protein